MYLGFSKTLISSIAVETFRDSKYYLKICFSKTTFPYQMAAHEEINLKNHKLSNKNQLRNLKNSQNNFFFFNPAIFARRLKKWFH